MKLTKQQKETLNRKGYYYKKIERDEFGYTWKIVYVKQLEGGKENENNKLC